jgi:hypothetical protein
MGDVKELFGELDEAGRSALSMQLLLFTCAYIEKRLKGTSPRTPETYVKVGVADVAVGIYGLDTGGKTLFAFLATAIAKRIDHDAEALSVGTRSPEKTKGLGH